MSLLTMQTPCLIRDEEGVQVQQVHKGNAGGISLHVIFRQSLATYDIMHLCF
jgi:hypothetical protein